MNLFNELKRRNVFRIAGIYAVVGWILMQVAGTLEASLRLPEWFDSVITAGLLIGFPIALLFAWAFEMTPDGVKPTESCDAENSSVPSKKIDSVIIVGITLILALGLWQQMSKPVVSQTKSTEAKTILSTAKKAPIKIAKETEILDASIAVLPFKDLSPAGDQEYFSDGMAEEILNVLVRVEALKVTSRTSAFQFKGSNKGIPEIAKQLKVRHVLEGSVRRSGNTLRITAQLIDTKDDTHLWSQTYDRPLTTDNVFAIQDEISNAIVKALSEKLVIKATLHLSLKKSTDNLSAYELFLKARPLFQSRKRLDEADSLLIQALKLDPKYAEAWAVHAALQSLMLEYGFSNIPVELNDKNGIQYADRALSLDPNLALALAVKSKIKLNATEFLREKYDVSQIIKNYKKALEIEPHNPSTLNWIGLAYQFLGFHKQAIEYFTLCVEYEPRYTPCLANLAITNQLLGNYEVAVRLYSEGLSNGVLELSDAPFWALAQLNNKLAFVSALNALSVFPRWHRNGEFYRAYKSPSLDHSELAKAAYNYLPDKAKITWFSQLVFTPLGYHDPSKELFVDVFGGIQKDINSPRIKTYIRKSGIYDYWEAQGYPPQCRAIGDDDFECDQISQFKKSSE